MFSNLVVHQKIDLKRKYGFVLKNTNLLFFRNEAIGGKSNSIVVLNLSHCKR